MSQEFVSQIREFAALALKEDVREGDFTSLSTIDAEAVGEANLLVKEDGVLAGVEAAKEILAFIDGSLVVTVFKRDGDVIATGDIVLRLEGRIHSILKGERLILNVMQRMSGIATKTNLYAKIIQDTKGKVLDTRKTTPLLRFLEKQAVRLGGGENHRFGLYDMILIKDNHVDYAGGIQKALTKAYDYVSAHRLGIPIEIEVRSFEELQEVVSFGKVDRIMFDNFTPHQVAEAVKLIEGKYITEASGGITLDTIREYALAGVDYISVGDLTHSVKSLDLSLKANLI